MSKPSNIHTYDDSIMQRIVSWIDAAQTGTYDHEEEERTVFPDSMGETYDRIRTFQLTESAQIKQEFYQYVYFRVDRYEWKDYCYAYDSATAKVVKLRAELEDNCDGDDLNEFLRYTFQQYAGALLHNPNAETNHFEVDRFSEGFPALVTPRILFDINSVLKYDIHFRCVTQPITVEQTNAFIKTLFNRLEQSEDVEEIVQLSKQVNYAANELYFKLMTYKPRYIGIFDEAYFNSWVQFSNKAFSALSMFTQIYLVRLKTLMSTRGVLQIQKGHFNDAFGFRITARVRNTPKITSKLVRNAPETVSSDDADEQPKWVKKRKQSPTSSKVEQVEFSAAKESKKAASKKEEKKPAKKRDLSYRERIVQESEKQVKRAKRPEKNAKFQVDKYELGSLVPINQAQEILRANERMMQAFQEEQQKQMQEMFERMSRNAHFPPVASTSVNEFRAWADNKIAEVDASSEAPEVYGAIGDSGDEREMDFGADHGAGAGSDVEESDGSEIL